MENKINVVTGASGHLGAALIRLLKEKGEYVRALVKNLDNNKSVKEIADEVLAADITDYHALQKAFEGADIVYHLAGIITLGRENKRLLKSVNVAGTQNVVDACLECGVKTLIYVSTAHTVDFKTKTEIIREKPIIDPKKLKGAYSKSKAEATNIVLRANCEKLKTVAVMPPGVIGPYATNRSNFAQFIIDYVNLKLRVKIDGEYNFVDVRDTAKAMCAAAGCGRGGESYLITGDKMSVEKMMSVLSCVSGVKMPKIKIPLWIIKAAAPFAELYYTIRKVKPLFTPASVYTLNSNANFDNSKAREELGFDPISAEESLIDEYNYLKENHPGYFKNRR